MSLDVFQQVFRLALISNGVSLGGVKGDQATLQKLLQSYLLAELPRTGAGWELAWGPVVWKNKPENTETGPDNSWFVAYHPRLEYEDGSVHPTYTIAIAGTPVESQYVWYFQNFPVNTVSDFKAWVANGLQFRPSIVPPRDVVQGNAYIATGTVNAVYLLLNTPAPEGAAAPGTTLLDFIANIDHSASPRFISTGFSLGGALSPSIALALVHSGVIPGDRALTYPIAGPSPGNVYFSELFVNTFPARKTGGSASYQGWNLNLANTLDIVPQSWASYKQISPEQNLLNIPTIYGEPAVPDVRNFTVVAIAWSRASAVLYKPIPSQYFTGPPPPVVPTTLKEFLAIASPQHLEAYLAEVGVSVIPVEAAGVATSTEDEKLYNLPIINGFQWALEHPKEAQEAADKLKDTQEGKALLGEL